MGFAAEYPRCRRRRDCGTDWTLQGRINMEEKVQRIDAVSVDKNEGGSST